MKEFQWIVKGNGNVTPGFDQLRDPFYADGVLKSIPYGLLRIRMDGYLEKLRCAALKDFRVFRDRNVAPCVVVFDRSISLLS